MARQVGLGVAARWRPGGWPVTAIGPRGIDLGGINAKGRAASHRATNHNRGLCLRRGTSGPWDGRPGFPAPSSPRSAEQTSQGRVKRENHALDPRPWLVSSLATPTSNVTMNACAPVVPKPLLALIVPASHEPRLVRRTGAFAVIIPASAPLNARSRTLGPPGASPTESPRVREPEAPRATGVPEAPNHSRNTLVPADRERERGRPIRRRR